jgi:hypothetical protein
VDRNQKTTKAPALFPSLAPAGRLYAAWLFGHAALHGPPGSSFPVHLFSRADAEPKEKMATKGEKHMNTTTKTLIGASMLMLAVLSVSGSASAFAYMSPGGGSGGTCNGVVDSNCVCKDDSSRCDPKEYCSTWADYICIIG